MSTIHSVKDLKESKASVKLAVISMLVLPVVGVGCLLGLVKAAGEFDEIIADIKRKEPFVFSLALCVFELVLAVLLILNPFANIEHHLLLLGLELIVYPFKLHRERGKFVLEAEA